MENCTDKAKMAALNIQTQKLRKANHEIGFVLTKGEMNFVTRKLYNTLIYHSQRLRKKGILPFELDWDLSSLPDGVDTKQCFWIPLKELIDDASSSKNYVLIRNWLTEMKSVTVSRSVPGVYEQISSILGDVIFLNSSPAIGGKKQGRWAVGWNFPPSLEPLLLDPKQFTPISLYYQSQMSSEAALVLYEIARRYAGWSEHRTEKKSWKEWQSVLVASKHPREQYKLFKRDFLKPAMAEINKKTDVEIELVEFSSGGSRAVNEIRFDVSLKSQQDLELPIGPAISTKLLEEMQAAGVAAGAAEKLLAEFGEERCSKNLNLYKINCSTKGAGWLVTAIRDDYFSAEKKIKPVERKSVGDKEAQCKVLESASAMQAIVKAEAGKQMVESKSRAQVKAKLDALPESERIALIDEYCETLAGSLAKSSRKIFMQGEWVTGSRDAKMFIAWLENRISVKKN